MARMVMEEDDEYFYETAFLSFASPDLAEAVARLAKKRVEKIIVMPIFLVRGNHIKCDIPQQMALIKNAHPDIEFVSTRHLGADPAIAAIVRERIAEAVSL